MALSSGLPDSMRLGDMTPFDGVRVASGVWLPDRATVPEVKPAVPESRQSALQAISAVGCDEAKSQQDSPTRH